MYYMFLSLFRQNRYFETFFHSFLHVGFFVSFVSSQIVICIGGSTRIKRNKIKFPYYF